MPNKKNLKKSSDLNNQNQSEFILYSSPEGKIKIDVLLQDETIWLTQKKIAELFEVDRSVITKHLKNIFDSKELVEESNVQKMHFPNSDKPVKLYNLDVIISVGYRVNSAEATKFRIWATQTLKEFIIKGFVLDSERLKNGSKFGKEYFDELLEKIREIRASERKFYQKITDIYASCSADYDPNSNITKEFYAIVQNKLHFCITGHTAAEIIKNRVDANKNHMGLTSWKNSPYGKILKPDVSIAKNYLAEKEIKELERIVVMYLDYAELQASRWKLMKMKDWVDRLDAFLKFNEYEILNNAGKVSYQVAKKLAEEEYEKFRVKQDREFISDFDKAVKKIEKKNE